MSRKEIAENLLTWYQEHARILPWRIPEKNRENPNPYHVWISEIMLQQTRVEAVKGYYQRFLERLPDVAALAKVPEDELMKLWQGLGYYNRARNLQKAAIIIMKEHHGKFPDKYEEILELPGIGEYTAGAIASIAFGERVPAVDGNVYRIYTRLFADSSDITKAGIKRKVREEILSMVPEENPGAFNQAWMDLGATICLPNGEPSCQECPIGEFCKARLQENPLDYPVKPAKKQRVQQEKTIIILECQGKYLLQKRPSKGLLAGLWEFPSQEGKLTLRELQSYLSEWKIKEEDIQLLGKGKHIFSHVEWHMLGYLVHLKQIPELLQESQGFWVSVDDMEENYSIPSAYAEYYKKIVNED